jgi:hypothetical protein
MVTSIGMPLMGLLSLISPESFSPSLMLFTLIFYRSKRDGKREEKMQSEVTGHCEKMTS